MNKSKEKMAFGLIVRTLRSKKGLNSQEFADRLKISRQHLGIIERGPNSPSMFLVFQIANALEIEPDDFLKILEDKM